MQPTDIYGYPFRNGQKLIDTSLNDICEAIAGISNSGTASIIDDEQTSTSKTWSSNKINSELSELSSSIITYTAGDGISISDNTISCTVESDEGGISVIPITYNELLSLVNESKLIPGTVYRITDFVTTTTQQDTQSAGHQFDILVTADDTNVLNENVKFAKHTGDTYFSKSLLSAWEGKYSLVNDKTRYNWADTENGKGVIYWLKDEYNNECPYDFKNIQFKRWKVGGEEYEVEVNDEMEQGPSQELCPLYDRYMAIVGEVDEETGVPSGNVMPEHYFAIEDDSLYFYTFSMVGATNQNVIFDSSLGVDLSSMGVNALLGLVSNNEIKTFADISAAESILAGQAGLLSLNNFVFYSEFTGPQDFVNLIVRGNNFGTDCCGNTFLNTCAYNTFGNNFKSNTVDEEVQYLDFRTNYPEDTLRYLHITNGCKSDSSQVIPSGIETDATYCQFIGLKTSGNGFEGRFTIKNIFD